MRDNATVMTNSWLLMFVLLGILFFIGYTLMPVYQTLAQLPIVDYSPSTPPSSLVRPIARYTQSLIAEQQQPTSTPPTATLNVQSTACLQQVSGGWICYGRLGNSGDEARSIPRLQATLYDDTQAIAQQAFVPIIPVIPPQSVIPFRVLFPAHLQPINQTPRMQLTFVETQPNHNNTPVSILQAEVQQVTVDAYGRYRVAYTVQPIEEERGQIGVAIWLEDSAGDIVGYRVQMLHPDAQQGRIQATMTLTPYVVVHDLTVHLVAWQ
jgi:hypothetical protein